MSGSEVEAAAVERERGIARRLLSASASAARFVLTAPILLYSRFVSPALPRRCKYEPTCSAYALDALRRYGALRGLALAAWRLLRCNPFSDGGYDPVEAQRLFKRPPRHGHGHGHGHGRCGAEHGGLAR